MYKKSIRLAMIATAMSFAFGAAHAATPDTASAPAAAHAWHHDGRGEHEHGKRGEHGHGGPIGLLKKVHDKLNLSAAQEQQYQSLLATAKQNREAAMKNRKQAFEQMKAQQSQAIIDFGALHQAQTQVQQQNAQLREQTAQAFLSFYNGLSDQQKTTFSSAVKERMAKFEQHRAEMKKKWEAKRAAQGASAPAAQ